LKSENSKKKWIAKNPNGCCGKGIKLVFDLNEFLKEVKTLKSNKNQDKRHFRYK
jgi:glutathione synthase/RimK-type ligase-like ATP-grasp enzyme